ncbi:Crp/Fnr family transcriptional regulator [Granulosicoccaceae sp. 1_MG-2023]|nr:Crp/Fnr family transcriptional regulator [Granulosicoccaceae sp. 1_MG-2023]
MQELLGEIPLFSCLSEEERDKVAGLAKLRSVRKNTVIVTQGEETNSFYIVLSGRLRVFRDDEDGNEVILNDLQRASWFGELAILAQTTRSASVVTLENSQLAIIAQQDLNRLLVENPLLTLGIARFLANRVIELTEDISDLAMLDVYGRVARTLEKHAREENGKLITNRFTHQEIAAMVGASREMISKILKELKIGGYIEIDGKRIILQKKLPKAW